MTTQTPNTYFCNRIASVDELNKALAVSNAHGSDGIFFCVSQRIKNKSLKKMLVRWKSETSCCFLEAKIIDIFDADSQRGKECRQNLHARPWSDLNDHQGGSVIHISNLKFVEPPKEVLEMKYIQSCKYINT
jgi:hypothetical protein